MNRITCTRCKRTNYPTLCLPCCDARSFALREDLVNHLVRIKTEQRIIEKILSGSAGCTLRDKQRNINAIDQQKLKNQILREKVSSFKAAITVQRTRVARTRELLDLRKKRAAVKSCELGAVPFDLYLKEHTKFDKGLNAMHPYKKLRSVAQSLADERRAAVIKLISIFRFRQVTIDGVSELVPETSDDNSCPALASTIVALTVSIIKVLDVCLPFPIVFGTLTTSPCLHSPASTYNSGSVSAYPRVLHSYKRVLLPVTGDATLSSYALLLEDLKYIWWTVDQASMAGLSDPLQIINQFISSSNLGREIANPLQRSFPSSPSLTASLSPSYRRSVIEQSVTEGGEWTLLDQL
jgi:hypothetical protein